MSDYYPRADLTRPNGGRMNFSVLTYHDRNGNGDYDLGDTPFAGAVVELLGAEEVIGTVRSNLSGFANFRASRNHDDATIKAPGSYLTRVVPPPGWTISSSNAEQPMEVAELIGAPADLVMVKPPEPVGLVLEADQLPQAGSASPSELGEAISTVTFEDLITHDGVGKIPNRYHGLNWRNWVVTHNRTYGGPGYLNGTITGDYVAYGGSGHPVELYSPDPFDFIGAYFTSAWPAAEGEGLTLQAWRGTQQLPNIEVELSRFAPLHLAPHLMGITRLNIATNHYWQAVIDQLQIRRSASR